MTIELVLKYVGFNPVTAFQGEYTSRPSVTHVYSAIVNITYIHPITKHLHSEYEEMGQYGINSSLESESGVVVHVRTATNETHGCSPPVNAPTTGRWIALIERGSCKFQQKIYNAAIVKNASAVVIYNHKFESVEPSMKHEGN